MSRYKCMFTYVLDVPANFRCAEHSHDCCEIVYCIGCSGVLIQDGRSYPYRDGSVFVYQPGANHVVENAIGGRHICIGVAGTGTAEIKPGVWDEGARLKSLFERIPETVKSDSPLKMERVDHLCALIALELRDLIPSDADDIAPVLVAKRIIEDSFDQEIDVASLAKAVYLSPDYFRYLFKLHVGQPVISYLIARRIEHAKARLSDSDDTIAQIGTECGFASPYYFSRAFKKVTGQAPQAYRREVKSRLE